MAKSKPSSEDDDILEEARKEFDRAYEAEQHNREPAEEDIRFARLGEQWPEAIKAEREKDGLPCLTINDLPAFIRQVVNDCRQNKPQIKVGPVDSGADVETAEIYSDLIRNIEQQSSADLAYDTGVDSAVTCGFGYWRIVLDYAHDDTFDQDIRIDRILDPMSVFGDPDSVSADGSDWNKAFIVDRLTKEQFEAQYGEDAEKIDWDAAGYTGLNDKWFSDTGDDAGVQIAEYWKREEVEKNICLLSDGSVISKEQLEEATDGIPYGDYLETIGVTIEKERTAKSWKVTQYILTGAEVLSTREWPGKHIPIVPIYGEEVYSKGKRYLRSLTRDVQDPSRNFNYWRSKATELVALAPRVPFIGAVGSFATDVSKWSRTNSASTAFVEYDVVPGAEKPSRQPLDTGAAAGAIQEAMNASDDKKRVMGLYDASLGARSNETSGKAIMARQREGDVSTFHFTDNQSRAIRHTGRILIDIIPPVYNKARIVRVLGEDGEARMVPLNQPVPVEGQDGQPQMQMGANGQPLVDPAGRPIPVTRIYDLAAGKYDLTVKAGPSFTSRREEAATQLIEVLRSAPDAAPFILPEIFKNLDLQGAEKIAEQLEAMIPSQATGGIPPEIQQQMDEAQQAFGALQEEKQGLEQQLAALTMKGQSTEAANQIAAMKLKVEAEKLKVDAFVAETQRYIALSNAHIDWTKLGIDMRLGLADMEMAHAQTAQHGLEHGQGGAPQPPQPQPQPMPMQGPGMIPPRPVPMNGPMPMMPRGPMPGMGQ